MSNGLESCELSCPIKEWCINTEVVAEQTGEILYGDAGMATLVMEYAEMLEDIAADLPMDSEIMQKAQAAREGLLRLTTLQDKLSPHTPKYDFENMAVNCDGRKSKEDLDDPTKVLIFCGSQALSDEQRFEVYKSVDKPL